MFPSAGTISDLNVFPSLASTWRHRNFHTEKVLATLVYCIIASSGQLLSSSVGSYHAKKNVAPIPSN